jgi:threonine dehydratase
MILVTNDEICAAIKDVFEDTRSVLEPSGALSLAGCKRWIQDNNAKGGHYIAITSGANMNFNRLRFVAERAEIGEETEALISVMIPETPGTFLQLYNAIHPRAVSELAYRYHNLDCAHVFASFHVSGEVNRDEEIQSILKLIQSYGMKGVDISRNEFAKSHARYLVGGRSAVAHERVFRFEFREKPGIIRDLLAHFRNYFNMSLFHFRNQGGDIGKVVMGLLVPPEENATLIKLLDMLAINYVEESDNVVYQHFMCGN